MHSSENISSSARSNFYLNLVNFVPFLIVITTGLVLQIGYHMHHLQNNHFVFYLNRSNWLILHKISASISLAGIIIHCILHWKFVSATFKKIMLRKSISPASLSYWLFIISIPTCLIAMTSWILFDHKEPVRFLLVETHDKLALLWIIFSILHIISRTGWMVRIYRKLS